MHLQFDINIYILNLYICFLLLLMIGNMIDKLFAKIQLGRQQARWVEYYALTFIYGKIYNHPTLFINYFFTYPDKICIKENLKFFT